MIISRTVWKQKKTVMPLFTLRSVKFAEPFWNCLMRIFELLNCLMRIFDEYTEFYNNYLSARTFLLWQLVERIWLIKWPIHDVCLWKYTKVYQALHNLKINVFLVIKLFKLWWFKSVCKVEIVFRFPLKFNG